MMGQITVLHLGFDYHQEVDIEKGRELVLAAGNRFLNEINADESRIRPYLAAYPFKPENIGIEIFFQNPDGSLLEPEKIHVVTMREGILEYVLENPILRRLEDFYKETYEEAAAKAAAASNGPALQFTANAL